MVLLDSPPSLTALHMLIGKISHFPISAGQVTNIAIKNGYGQDVIDFYRAFPHDSIFGSKEDLTARSEQISIFERQYDDEPEELLSSPEEG